VRIAIFGASGRTGRKVIEQALERGHDVTAFVRDASRFGTTHDPLEVAEGDARDPEAVGEAVRGKDAIISVLSLAKPEDEPQHSEATRTVVEALGRENVRRIVVTANNHVFGDDEVTGEFAAAAREHRRNRDLLRATGLGWTIGAAPSVVDEPGSGYEVVADGKAPGKKIATADFAAFTLDALERDEWIGRVVGVSSVV
jgi:putative NADH-flavin reductase